MEAALAATAAVVMEVVSAVVMEAATAAAMADDQEVGRTVLEGAAEGMEAAATAVARVAATARADLA